jgi:hypothetical protein
MDAEPSIICGVPGGANARMRHVATATIVVYILGLPAAFAMFLWRNRVAIRVDQRLREKGEGDSMLTNAHIKVSGAGYLALLTSPTGQHIPFHGQP